MLKKIIEQFTWSRFTSLDDYNSSEFKDLHHIARTLISKIQTCAKPLKKFFFAINSISILKTGVFITSLSRILKMCCMIFLIKLGTLELDDEMVGFLEFLSFIRSNTFPVIISITLYFFKIIILEIQFNKIMKRAQSFKSALQLSRLHWI